MAHQSKRKQRAKGRKVAAAGRRADAAEEVDLGGGRRGRVVGMDERIDLTKGPTPKFVAVHKWKTKWVRPAGALLIDLDVPPYWTPRVRAMCARGRMARRFVLDADATEKVWALARDQTDLISELQPFAVAPFPNCYIEIPTGRGGTVDASLPFLGFIVTSEYVAQIVEGDGNRDGMVDNRDDIMMNPFIVDRATLSTVWTLDAESLPEQSDDAELLRRDMMAGAVFCNALFLLLHETHAVTISDKPPTSRIIKGKRKAYAAHSVVSINLTAREIKRVITTGARGPSRRHEVRSTWVHRGTSGQCSHEWSEARLDDGTWAVREDGRPRLRYRCDLCAGLRVIRYEHERGDASIGYVTHDRYEVSA